jgi:hypothetical protein
MNAMFDKSPQPKEGFKKHSEGNFQSAAPIGIVGNDEARHAARAARPVVRGRKAAPAPGELFAIAGRAG